MSWLSRLFGGGGGGDGGAAQAFQFTPCPPADPEAFWEIINQTTGRAQDDQAEALKRALAPLPAEQLKAFYCDYRRALDTAYRWDLWGAAYTIQGGCSDDGFDYFCDWLISRGRAAYDAALADPESLVTVLDTMSEDEDAEFELFRYVVIEVFEEKTGESFPMMSPDTSNGGPAGTKWKEKDLPGMFPKLNAWADARG